MEDLIMVGLSLHIEATWGGGETPGLSGSLISNY